MQRLLWLLPLAVEAMTLPAAAVKQLAIVAKQGAVVGVGGGARTKVSGQLPFERG